MAQLSTKIKKYLAERGVNTVDFNSDVLLQDDSNGSGPYIKEWNIDEAGLHAMFNRDGETLRLLDDANRLVEMI